MSYLDIEKLTPEQEALITFYRDKWRAIALSTERINRKKASAAVKAAYAAIDESEPEIIFCDSPYGTDSQVSKLENSGVYDIYDSLLHHYLENDLEISTSIFYKEPLSSEVRSLLDLRLFYQWEGQLGLSTEFNSMINPIEWAMYGSMYEVYISVLNCPHNERQWEAFQALLENCGCVFPFEKIAIVCDRPIKLSFDDQQRLHSQATNRTSEPAIQFADGYSLYFYHGVTLPEKYGVLPPNQWQAKWLLSEKNAELRRVLIQGIGYARIASELQATELDYWQEYTLLKIDGYVKEEPIYLLKMTCPSTSFIHVLRVPPNMSSARDAIAWVNWGIDPEEFSVQS